MPRNATPPLDLYRAFVSDVAKGAIRPGERLGEESLAARWKVGRVPVRETLMRLEQDGLVVRKSKSGTYVREINDEEVLEIFDIRIGIEPIIAAEAARRITDAHMPELRKLAEAADELGAPTYELESRDRAFHSFLGQLSDLRHAPRIISVSRLHLRCATISRFKALLGEYTISTPDHRPIAAAIAARDARRAAAVMTLHLRHAKQAVMTDMKRVNKHLAAIGHTSHSDLSRSLV